MCTRSEASCEPTTAWRPAFRLAQSPPGARWSTPAPPRPSGRLHEARRLVKAVTGAALAFALLVGACAEDGDDAPPAEAGPGEGAAVAVLTGVVSPTGRTFLLHLIESLRPGTVLDVGRAIEFPAAAISAHGGFLYVVDEESLTVTKYSVTETLLIEEEGRLSLQGVGAQSPSRPHWDSAGQPYIVDPGSQQVIRFDPDRMTLLDATPFPAAFTEREGIPASVTAYEGVERDGRMWFNWSWVNFAQARAVLEVAVSSFAMGDGPPTFAAPLLDARCPFSGGYPFVGPEGDLYAVGLSFWDPAAQSLTGSCILRLPSGETAFDPDYRLDLLAATDASFIGGTWPMDEGRKLVVHYLAAEGPQPDMERLDLVYVTPEYRTAVIDLATGEAVEVDVPRTAIGTWFGLTLDGVPYIQLYPEAAFDNAVLTRIHPDGTAEVIMEAGSGADFRAIERIR